MSSVISLDHAVRLVKDGDTIAFGGNVLFRSPIQAAAQLALSGVKNLHIVKTANAMEADILCGMGCVASVAAGFVGYEGEYGLCAFYRKAVESGKVQAREHACYTVITALRAAAQGVPFLPVRGMLGSDLMSAVGFKTVADPYTGEVLCAVKAIQPDVAFIHVQKADRFGNAEIIGPQYEDQYVARSAKVLVLTCEELVPDNYFGEKRKADISQVLTDYVVHLPGGASPGACEGYYETNAGAMHAFKKLTTAEDLIDYLQEEVFST